MDVSIREATPADVAPLQILRQQALEAAYRDQFDASEVADIVTRAGADLHQYIADDATTVLLIETEVTVVGFGTVDTEGGRIESLYTSPDYQREGFASQLLARLEDRYVAGNLDAVAPDQATPFFEAHGYQTDGTTEWHGLPATRLRKQR